MTKRQEATKERIVNKKPHRNLVAWQKTMDFAVNIYEVTRDFPPTELYALTSQLRRAAVSSAPSNIAEGAAGRTRQQFSNYLSNAIGSLNEMDTQLELSLRLGYLATDYAPLWQALDGRLSLMA